MKKILLLLLLLSSLMTATAQRKTDPLDRGLVAVELKSGVFCSWRILAEEYYDVTYNIYRNGTKLNSEPLNVSNYTDASGTASNTYTVTAVVNGVEQSACAAVTPWNTGRVDTSNKVLYPAPAYLPIQMKDVVDRNGNIVFCCCGEHSPSDDVAQNYTLNDCSVADLDGDGEIEIIVKRLNASDANASDAYAHNSEIYSTTNTRAFVIIEAYKLNGTRLWWIDCGPNMVSLNSTEINAVAYDWDEDGKAEVIMRGADNMIIHKADGSVYNVGNMSYNSRSDFNHTNAQYAWTKIGSEYLMYLNGATANPYSISEFPLKRLEDGETLASAWSEGNTKQAYGHRSSKYFFGAPVLDGRKASIFLARGIYTQTKMIALDVNPSTHALTTKWTWKCNTSGSQWYGQGNHNMTVADVDGDGCDEIVYGSMVIDNNGKGLSTTGLGHGDAAHTSDLDPFRKGMETFACNEDNPGHNWRNATTCEIYHRHSASSDDGRAMAGNFSNEYPGSIGASVTSGVLSLTTDEEITGLTNGCFSKPWTPMSLNGIIYWDGDLCAEAFDSPGTQSEGVVSKLGTRIMQTSGCNLNNDSKNNPCAQGDILGDWREELILRQYDNKALRVYTTTDPTSYRIPSLWFDPEYRQAMVWQMCAYNQPPHPSFFLGELEGITAAPPALTNTGKTEIAADATITTEQDGKDLLVVVEPSKSTNNRYTIKYSGKIAPATLTINAPVIVSGNDNNNNITSTTYTCYLNPSGGSSDSFSGSMRLIKRGEGVLDLYKKTLGHTGQTDIWEGTLNYSGNMSNSKVWMNRHTTLNTTSGSFNGGIEMNYNSTFNITTSATVSDLTLNYGSRVALTVASTSDAAQNGQLKVNGTLTVDKKDWQYGPTYLAPVLKVNSTSALAIGNYPIGTVSTVNGSLSDIIVEGNFAANTKQIVTATDKTLYLTVYDGTSDPGVTSTLVHTGSTYANLSNGTISYSVDTEKEHFNNEGKNSWDGYAFAQFNFSIPSGKQIKSATLKWRGTSEKWYTSEIYYLKSGKSVDFNAISAGTSGLLRMDNEKNHICQIASLQNGVYNSTDVTDAVKAMESVGTIYFQWTGNSGGADLYGKGSTEYAPTLSITIEDRASDDSPIDMTSYIQDADFTGCTSSATAAYESGTYGAWNWTKKGTSNSNGPTYTNSFEFWNKDVTQFGFDINQTISNLPVGTYKLAAKANNSLNGEAKSGDGQAYLYALVGDATAENAVAVDYNTDAATVYRDYEVIFKVTTAGQSVKIGFKTGYEAMAARWFSGDAFTLTYYGEESTKKVTPAMDIDSAPASDANPITMTSYIVDAGFDGAAVSGSSFGGWTWEKSSGSNGPKYPYNASTAADITACEFWNATAASLTFNLSQTVSSLPAGTYKLTVDARNSYDNVDSQSASGAAYLYATVDNDAIFHSAKITPTTSRDGSTTYEVIFKVTDGADVTVGVKNVGTMDARWLWMDNFTLTYYGTSSSLTASEDASIPSYVLGRELSWDEVKGGTQMFALVSSDKVLYGTDKQNLAFNAVSTSLKEDNTVTLWQVSDNDVTNVGGYLLHGYNLAGTAHSAFGGSAYLNAQPNIGGVTFVLNSSGSECEGGQDMQNGAIWNVAAVTNGYTLQCVGNSGYLAGTTTTATAEKVWKFYQVKKEGEADLTAYTITYALDGATGTAPTQADLVEGGIFTVASADGITKSGYTFKGWNDGTTTYYAGNKYTVATSNVTLTAQWEELPAVATKTTWDFSEYTDQVTLADNNTSIYYNGLTLVGNTTANYTNDYVKSTTGFHCNGVSSPTTRHIKFTPTCNGIWKVTGKGNGKSTPRIIAIGTSVVTFNTLPETLADGVLAAAETSDGNNSQTATIEAYLTAGKTYYAYFAEGGSSITKLEYIPTVTATVAATRTFGTFSSLYNVDFSDASSTDMIAAYTVKYNSSNGTLLLTRHKDVLPAGNGVVLYAPTDTKTWTFATVDETTATVADNDMVGVPVATSVAVSTTRDNVTYWNYVMSANQFHPLSSAGTIAAGKAYLSIARNPSSSNAKALTLSFADDEATGINAAPAIEDGDFLGDGIIYTLQGQRVLHPAKGMIYIIGGKKVLFK